jgi:hypothetical protein
VQYICHERLRANGSKDAQTSSDEENEAEVKEEEEESDDEFCDRTTSPVPKWEALAGDRAVHRPQFSQRAAASTHPQAGPDRSPPTPTGWNKLTKQLTNRAVWAQLCQQLYPPLP